MKAIRNALLIVILTLVSAEAFLRFADPFNLTALLDAAAVHHRMIAHPTRQYVTAPGTYTFASWSATVNEAYERVVPDTMGTYEVVFLGDSATFGRGVNDDETWVNLVAQTLHIRAINAGTDGYNSAHVRATLGDYAPDEFVYLIIGNDNEAGIDLSTLPPPANYQTALNWYLAFMFREPEQPILDEARFSQDMDTLAAISNMTLVAFDTDLGRELAARWPVQLIPEYTARLGYADPHPNREGHEQIARSMITILDEMWSNRYPAEVPG